MEKWRDACDKGERLSADVQTELEKLIEADQEGLAKRTKKIADEVKVC